MSKAVHINGQEYPYKVSRAGVRWYTPDGKPHFVNMSELTGWTNDALERANWKGYPPAVKPSDVKEYLIKKLEL